MTSCSDFIIIELVVYSQASGSVRLYSTGTVGFELNAKMSIVTISQ